MAAGPRRHESRFTRYITQLRYAPPRKSPARALEMLGTLSRDKDNERFRDDVRRSYYCCAVVARRDLRCSELLTRICLLERAPTGPGALQN